MNDFDNASETFELGNEVWSLGSIIFEGYEVVTCIFGSMLRIQSELEVELNSSDLINLQKSFILPSIASCVLRWSSDNF